MTKKLNKKQLEELVNSLSWNEGFGCYTRAGFEKIIWPEIADKAKWIIFFDVDNMNRLNDAHGQDTVDAMIKKSLAMRDTDYVASQWKSGDEFVVCVTEDGSREVSNPISLCERLKEAFLENGIPATFGIAPVISRDLRENVQPAYKRVWTEKKANHRGRIHFEGGEK